MKKHLKVLITLFSLIVIIISWQVAANVIKSSLILPSPTSVFSTMLKLIFKSEFWEHFFYTMFRVFTSFAIALFLGGIIGVFSGLNPFIKQFFKLPLVIIKSTPVVAIILVALFWLKSNTIPIFVSVLMTLPIIATNVTNGFLNVNKNLLQMANLYNFTFFQKFFKIQLPAVIPYFVSGINSAFGLSWKVVIAGEILSLPQKAIGTVLSKAQIHLESHLVLAYTILIIIFSFLIEALISFIIKKLSKRYKWNY